MYPYKMKNYHQLDLMALFHLLDNYIYFMLK
jgi:hypothetical protein